MKYKWKIVLLAALVLFIDNPRVPAQGPPVRVHAAYAAIAGDHAALYVAHEAGLFAKHGLDARFVYIASAPAIIPALLGGDIDFAVASGNGVVNAGLGGADLVWMAGMVNTAAYYLAVQPEIRTINDLRGRPLGVTRIGSATDFVLRFLLRKAGLDAEKDFQILQMGGQPELAVAIENRRIFGTVTTPPALVKMQKAGAHVLLAPKDIALRFPHVGIVVRKRFLAENREVVKNFIRAYSAGIPMVFNDKENSKRLMTRFIRSKEPDLLEATWRYAVDSLEQIPYPDPEGFKVILDALSRTRGETVVAKPEQFIEDGIVGELERQGFFKKLYGR
jgi:NitT/TauT family transport system substrate-binding protein